MHSTLMTAMGVIFFLGANGGLVLSLVQVKCWVFFIRSDSCIAVLEWLHQLFLFTASLLIIL